MTDIEVPEGYMSWPEWDALLRATPVEELDEGSEQWCEKVDQQWEADHPLRTRLITWVVGTTYQLSAWLERRNFDWLHRLLGKPNPWLSSEAEDWNSRLVRDDDGNIFGIREVDGTVTLF